MRPIWSAVFLVLAGCDSPSPQFMRTPAQIIEVQGSQISVRIKNSEAEAIRLSRQRSLRATSHMPHLIVAIERASGCMVVRSSVKGDQALVRAKIQCPG